jgi:hypothetical protein
VAVREIYQRPRIDPAHPTGSVALTDALFYDRCIRLPGRSAVAWPDGVPAGFRSGVSVTNVISQLVAVLHLTVWSRRSVGSR